MVTTAREMPSQLLELRLRLLPSLDIMVMEVMVSDMVMEAMVLDTEDTATVVTMARERLRLKLVIMGIVDMFVMVMDTEVMDIMVITMAREMLMLRLRLVIIMDTVDMDMVTEATDMDTMDKSKVSFIQTVLSSESEPKII